MCILIGWGKVLDSAFSLFSFLGYISALRRIDWPWPKIKQSKDMQTFFESTGSCRWTCNKTRTRSKNNQFNWLPNCGVGGGVVVNVYSGIFIWMGNKPNLS